jgi:prepilin-type N-terminal cleavage/methylation domain-containing protein
MVTRRASEAGFTLLEVTVCVALVGTLAAIALPSIVSSARASETKSEVNAVMGELRIRERAYMAEKMLYLSTGANENDMFPATPSTSPQSLSSVPASWSALRVRLPATATCSYVVVAGTPTSSAGTIATTTFAYVKPTKNDWFYVLAKCTEEGKTTYYFSSDTDTAIRKSP